MSKKFKYVLILFFISVCGIGQDAYTDSLLNAMKKTGEDTNKVNLLNQISREFYLQTDYVKAMPYASQAKTLAEKLAFNKGIATALKNMGNIYSDQGAYPKALDCQLAALKIWKELKDQYGTANSLTNVGNIFYYQSDFSKALEYYAEAKKIYEELKKQNTSQYLNVLMSLGATLGNQKNFNEALVYNLKAIDLGNSLGDRQGVAMSLNSIGNIYKEDKLDNTKALEYYLKSLKIFEETDDKFNLATLYKNIGFIYHLEKNDKEALRYYTKSLSVAKEIEARDLVADAQLALSYAYKEMRDYANAYKHLDSYNSERDSVFNEQNIKKLAAQEFKAKEDEINAKNKEEQLKKEAELKQQKIISLSFTFGFLLVLVLIFVVFRSLKQSKEKNKIIESQKIEVEFKNALVEHKNKEIIDSITYAKRLQEAILPTLKLVQEYLTQSFILYKPKDIVAGDFYWMETKNETVWIAAADCTGHGVPGAMVSVVCSNALNQSFKEFELREPGRILDKTRDLVFETFSKSDKDVKDGMDISLCSINTKTKEIKWAGANNPLWYIQNGELKEITANKQPIGKTDNPKPFTTHTILLNTNDSLYLFTDGYADQFGGPKGKKLKYKQMGEDILSGSSKSLLEQKEILEQAFDNWKGELEQVDDVCMIGIKL